MKNRTKNTLLFAVVISAATLLLWWFESPVVKPDSVNSSAPESPQSAMPNGNTGLPARTPTRAEEILSAAKANTQATPFYGKVIDQDSNPVVDATVEVGAAYNNFIKQGVRNYKTETDAEGNFVFPKIEGKHFGCEPWKEGYYYEPAKNYNGFIISRLAPAKERFTADPKKPEIFRMWKIKGAEPLLAGGLAFYTPPDGTPMYVDLKTGRKSKERGDIAFWCKYQVLPKDTPQEERVIDWKFGIRIVGGGVIPTDTKLPYGAPEDGYQEEWEFEIKKGSEGWPMKDQTFYFKTANQEYGALNVKARYDPVYPECSAEIGWKINPGGTRNLEPGKEEMIRKGSFGKPGVTLEYLRLNQG